MYCPQCKKDVTVSAEGYGQGPEDDCDILFCDECGEELGERSVAEREWEKACEVADSDIDKY